MARVSQVQLVLSLLWPALLLGGALAPALAVPALLVVGCAAGAVRARQR